MLTRLSLRLRVFLFFGFLALSSLVILGGAGAVAWARLDPADPAGALVLAGLISGFGLLAVTLFVWRLFDENVARAVETVSAAMRARAHGGVARDLDPDTAKYLADLAPAAAAMTDTLSDTKASVEEVIARETALLASQTDKLTALVSDVPVGLIICAPDHRIIFYNDPARQLLAEAGKPRLDRSVFDLLREAPIRRSYDRLVSSKGAQDAEFLLSTTGAARSLSAHIRLVRDTMGLGTDRPGYVLTLRDVTSDLSMHRDRERMLSEMVDHLRRPGAGLRALLDLHREFPEGANPSLTRDVLERAEALSVAVQSVAEDYDATWRSWWPMQEVSAAELIDGIRAHLADDAPVLEARTEDMILQCDAVSIIDLVAHLIAWLGTQNAVEVVSLTLSLTDLDAELRLSWQGEPVAVSALESALDQPVDLEGTSLTGREILDHHGIEIWPEWDDKGGAWLTLPLSDAAAAPELHAPEPFVPERTAVFDFDLLERTDHAAIDDTPLSKLTYVVFDTETTGLNPNGGDEIVQIAAVRVLNGRMVPGEVIDQLVDPERTIPPGATAVHGISPEMVIGQPTIREAGAQFHRFCQNAVLVAHNAPFDMAFFHRHGPSFDARFDNPVLDTVLLSAVLFGSHEEHTLDALADRFGVVIPEEARHTALGDTLATAEVFLRMIPMLEAKGMRTYGEVLAAMAQNSRLMKEMQARVSG